MKKIVDELKVGIKNLSNPTYNNIDKLMRKIMKKYDLTAKELHYGFRDLTNDKTPDEWIKGEHKMKTFKEFLEEAYLIQEMRKEDKVKGKKKTPMYVDRTTRHVRNAPDGSTKKWERVDVKTKVPNALAMTSRMMQGLSPTPEDKPRETAYSTVGGRLDFGGQMHAHGKGGAKRGVKAEKGKKIGRTREDGLTPAEKVKRKSNDPTLTWDYKTQKRS
jgi:hypothetical protein